MRAPLTARGIGTLLTAVACLAIGAHVGIPELAYVGVLLLTALGVALAAVSLAGPITVTARHLEPDLIPVDSVAAMRVELTIPGVAPRLPARWHDQLPVGLSVTHSGLAPGGTDTGLVVFAPLGSASALAPVRMATGLLPSLAARGRGRGLSVEYSIYGMRRGSHSVGPFTVRTSDPFGLARRTTTAVASETTVTVVPVASALAPLQDSFRATGGALETRVTQLGQGADNLIARPYLPGDSMRRIHWRATAHRDELMVRQEEQESNPEAIVVFDRGVSRWSTEAMDAPGRDPGFETAISACVSVLLRLLQDGYAVTVIDTDGTELIARATDAIEFAEALRAAATLTARPGDHLTALPRLLTTGMLGPVVVITGRVDAADVAELAGLPRHCALPVLLAAAPLPGALLQARKHGWRTGAIPVGANLPRVWA